MSVHLSGHRPRDGGERELTPQLVDFEAHHLDTFKHAPRDAETIALIDQRFLDQYVGKAASVVFEGRTLMIAGIGEDDEGTVHIWALVSEEMPRRFPFTLARLLEMGLLGVEAHNPVKRIEARIVDDYEAGHRWLARHGFRVYNAELGTSHYVKWA